MEIESIPLLNESTNRRPTASANPVTTADRLNNIGQFLKTIDQGSTQPFGRIARKLNFDNSDTYPVILDSSEMQLAGGRKCDRRRPKTPDLLFPHTPQRLMATPIKRNPNVMVMIDHQNQNLSPPYKRVRNLRLLDSPATPKTILQKSAAFPPPATSYYRNHVPFSVVTDRSFNKNPFTQDSIHNMSKKRSRSKRSLVSSPLSNDEPNDKNNNSRDFENESENDTDESLSLNCSTSSIANSNYNSTLNGNFNTNNYDKSSFFTPTRGLCATIPSVGASDNMDLEDEHFSKRVALEESNISRYNKEFVELELIGVGQFGSVHKCLNRLDGITYAIKKSLKPIAGSYFEKTALNEVYAHAVLGKHQHVVRYYSAWAEDNRMVIQNEYCNGGSLADHIAERIRNKTPPMTENELKQLLCHISEGLRYIHSLHLVHMDIKPANIFISTESRCLHSSNYDSSDDGFEETEEISVNEITYKIGDLGHVTSVTKPQVEEGDCRYLALEILNEDYTHLQKADIFALGLTVYEAAAGTPLPSNGEQYQAIRRNAELPVLDHCSDDFNELLKLMISRDPEQRPTATQLRHHKVLAPNGIKTKAQLRRELNAEKLKNEFLSNQLEEANRIIKTVSPVLSSNAANNNIKNPNFPKSLGRLIGKTVNRSNSTTIF